jgi:hypothetical protein
MSALPSPNETPVALLFGCVFDVCGLDPAAARRLVEDIGAQTDWIFENREQLMAFIADPGQADTRVVVGVVGSVEGASPSATIASAKKQARAAVKILERVGTDFGSFAATISGFGATVTCAEPAPAWHACADTQSGGGWLVGVSSEGPPVPFLRVDPGHVLPVAMDKKLFAAAQKAFEELGRSEPVYSVGTLGTASVS